jgi:TOTE conflict system primase-like protein
LYESATPFDFWCRDRRLAIFELNRPYRIGIIRENKHWRTTVFAMKQTDTRITELMARLTALERERADVVAEINTLRSMQSEETEPIKVVPSGNAGDPTDRNSPIEKKLALFRRLFAGRSDVFPIRWENRTTGRSGYAPACAK